ncbi:MAG: Gfo/Idh/MocA family oxidoreductase [Candidatus Competibacterales bacterium]|nr:Gfo/Idh/MocA family oxidoreductase [Candidatus Competibacterales bacterium]
MLNAAVVGLGWWGQVLARAVHGSSDRIRIVRGITRTPARAAEFAAETGIPVDADYAAALHDPGIDAVVLATPHSQHLAQVQAAAAAGKHVFVEKPLALTAADAAAAYAACEAAGVVLAVGQNRRFLPAIRHLREQIAQGTLGHILHLEGNFSGSSGYRHRPGVWRASAAESPAGGMTGKGLHVTDLMIALCGPIREVDARSLRQVLEIEMDDTTVMLLGFASGATGYLGTLTATADVWRLQVFGSEGWAEMRGHHRLIVKPVTGEAQVLDFPPEDIERAELEAFAEAVAGGDPFPVDRAQVINNIALLEAIGRSAREGRPVTVDA